MAVIELLSTLIVCLVYFDTNEHGNKTTYMVPLRNITYNVNIVNTLAEVEIVQEYFNDRSTFLETNYLFPVSVDAAFTSLEVYFRGKLIKSVIKEKNEAKQIYEAGKAEGKLVGYGETTSPDVMNIKIGNIPPNESVTVIFKYIESLEVQSNKFWRFIISSTLTPRYYSRNHPNTDNTPPIKTTSELQYTWDINVNIATSSPITSLSANLENAVTSYHTNSGKISFKRGTKNYPNKNFVLLFQTQDMNYPSLSLSHYNITNSDGSVSQKYCGHFAFLPNMTENSLAFNEVRVEFIFVLDRSGSMSGDRIAYAKDALKTFLQNLPADCYFDIISFGSDYSSYAGKETIKKSDDAISKALNFVSSIDADMGGTEIYDPLKEAIVNKPLKSGYPRHVFMFTDGDVGNTDEVIKLVGSSKDVIVNVIGIGSGASEYLVKEVARAGYGVYEMVADPSRLQEKIVFMMQKSILPMTKSIVVDYDESVMALATPNSKFGSYVRLGDIYNAFFFLNDNFAQSGKTKLTLTYIQPFTNSKTSISFELNKNTAFDSEQLHKLGVFFMIKSLESMQRSSYSWSGKSTFDAYIPDISSIDSEILSLSLRYQVLSSKTAFVLVSNETVKEGNEKTASVDVENLDSADYSSSGSYSNSTSMSYSSSAVMYAKTGAILLVTFLAALLPFITFIFA